MEEGFKNRVILILGILSILFFIVAVGSCSNARRHRLDLDKEKTTSWDLQKKIEEFKQEKASVEGELKSKAKELEEEKTGHQATQKTLLQEQLVAKKLQEELEKMSRLKEALEEDLKEALVTGKVRTKK